MKLSLWLLCVGGLLGGYNAPSAAADDAGGVRGWYIGNSVGSTTPKAKNFAISQSWSLDAGYRFKYLSSELSNSELGQFRYKNAAAPDSDVRVSGVSLLAVPRYEVNSWLALEALHGVYHWRRKAQAFGVQLDSDKGTDMTFGAGLWFQLKGRVALNLRWRRYDNSSGTDLSQTAFGVRYVFH
jgi:opacity protein-like surface antigen